MARRIELRLRVGERQDVPLAGAGSVGYGWEVSWQGHVGVATAHVEADIPIDPPMGGSFPQRLRVEGLQTGQVTFFLRLARSFDKRRPPRDEVEIVVHVVG